MSSSTKVEPGNNSNNNSNSSKKSIKVDMSTRIGGRVVQPALPVVDSAPPTATELSFNASLDQFCSANIPLEPTDGIQTRERVLNRMGAVCRAWIKGVCHKRGLPPDVVATAGGSLFTSGSYRLGVHEPGADIDTILVAPHVCSRLDFFGEVLTSNDGKETRDPESLAERIKRHPDVTNFVPVEEAAVPILTFDWEGINIDLLFARLNSNSVPADFDIDNDAVLDGVDSATEKSLNGPRVTNLIAALVSGTPERYQTFLAVVRVVRKWAKARGLYSNKMGYWGGVNINIAVALCVQLYPVATPASLLRKFFLVFKTWRWPNPVMLTKPHDANLGLTVWNAHSVNNARQVAPIITPAYPAMNSTLSMTRQTLQIMHEEFCRGHEIVTRLWKQHEADSASELEWKELLEPSDFFIAYPQYLSLCIVGPTQEDAQKWIAFCESRLRKLTSDMLGRSLPLSKIQLWPKKLEACIADRSALLTLAQRKNCITYMIGFAVDKLRMRGDQLNVEQQLHNFREWELSRFRDIVPGMDVCAKTFRVKELPQVCFDGIYEGGKAEAMKKRRDRLEADPKRQEKKRLARLAELKQKMAEIQKQKQQQKEEEAAAKQEEEDAKVVADKDDDDDAKDDETMAEEDEDGTKKRKRDDNDESDTATDLVQVKEEIAAVAQEEPTAVEEEEDANLLQSALDTLGGDVTREEAEAEKRKLLDGTLVEEGPYQADEDDEEEYTGDYRDNVVLLRTAADAGKGSTSKHSKYYLPVPEEDREMLRKVGINLVSDEDVEVIKSLPPPWWGEAVERKKKKAKGPVFTKNSKVIFKEKFDIVELDAEGFVIDKGDDDFHPSKTWTGRQAGFEFKLGQRGQGYYRTGKKVVVPSNVSYSC
ncbi:Nuclear poly(A) polymerase [Seminavis robusta]|uniref:polynucleotide adenylyltransferase n=1 Tax=Seminavis robusta TaxID=568900 RepID=A0A9N8H518_9STRA|nr:Nuclear poly(A) polymerase [Seminavis robusta]|eukprot:Sro130_g061970.1 Nuclear poly(A) polymerase (876) ;mRNA; r:65378-68005